MKDPGLTISNDLKLTCDHENYENNRDQFEFRLLGIHDHWLSEAEASMQMLSYPVLRDENADMSIYLKKERSLIALLKTIFKNHLVLKCREAKHYKFSSLEEFSSTCRKSIREIDKFTLHCPDLGLTVYGNFDMSLAFIFSKSNNGLSVIERYVALFSDLFLLK
jgi:hypothetical protein